VRDFYLDDLGTSFTGVQVKVFPSN